jgi:multiple sugar transport system substrate-binding protein
VAAASGLAGIAAACAPSAPAPVASSTPKLLTAADAQGATGTIKVLWTAYGLGKSFDPIMAGFTSKTGVQIQQTVVSYNDLYNKVTTAGLAGGHTYDAIEMDTIWAGAFAAAGFTEDLSNVWTDQQKALIAKPALDAVSYNGKMYGLPWINSAKHFYWNQAYLDAAGVTPPTTLDEMEQACITLKAKAPAGMAFPMSWSWKQFEGLTCDYVGLVASYGGTIFDSSNKPIFNQDLGVKALDLMNRHLNDLKIVDPSSLNYTENDVQNSWLAGQIAMMSNWEGSMSLSNTPASSKIVGHGRMGLLPGSSAVKSGSCLGPEGVGVMKSAGNKAGGLAWVMYMADHAVQKDMFLKTGAYPIYSDLYTDPDVAAAVTTSDGVNDLATYGDQFNYAKPRPNYPGYTQVSAAIQLAIHKALTGQSTSKQALDDAATQVITLLKQYHVI